MKRLLFGLLALACVSIGWVGWNQDQEFGQVTIDNSLYVKNNVPASTGWMLYNNGGTLFWNGSAVGVGTGSGAWGAITGTLSAQTDLQNALDAKVPTSRTVNGKALSSNITLNVNGDIDASIYALDTDLAAYVPITRTINSKPLSGNIVIGQGDIDLSLYAPKANPIFSGTVTASVDNTSDIGTAANSFKDIHADGVIYGSSLSLAGAGTTYFSTAVGVGSGASSPRNMLDIDGASYFSGDVTVGASPAITYATAAGDMLVKGIVSADGGIYSIGSGNYFSGNVGVGTVNPRSAFELNVGGAATGMTLANTGLNPVSNPDTVANYILNLRLDSSNDSAGVGIGFGITTAQSTMGASIYHVRKGTNDYGDLVFATKANGGNVAEKMRLDSAGNLGIGTNAPLGKLEVDGNIYVPSANLTRGYALCMAATGVMGHCTTTPTNGACTCVAN